MKDLIIFGAGDVGKFIAYNLNIFNASYNLLGFMDSDLRKVGTQLCGLPILTTECLNLVNTGRLCVVVAVSSPIAKESIVKKLEPYGVDFPNFIAQNSWLSNGVAIGYGNIIYPNCSINYETEIENFVTINAGCVIGHNVKIGRFANLSPGVNLGGFTRVGQGANLGIGCCSRQGVEIGSYSVVGGQAMLVKNVESNKTVVGVPAIIKE